MSVATPTVLPRSLLFPNLLPNPPHPHPTPLFQHGHRTGRLNSRRDLQREMDDLSEEETELEELMTAIKRRGYNFIVPIGRTHTLHEEKNDADEDDEDESGSSDSSHSNGASEEDEDEDEEEEEDLDADMDDLDEAGDITGGTAEQNDEDEDMEGEDEDEDFGEGSSEV